MSKDIKGRDLYLVQKCSTIGCESVEFHVPFSPQPGRPVFCSPCIAKIRAARKPKA